MAEMETELKNINDKSIERLIKYLNSGFKIIMEADLVALLFHCALIENKSLFNKVHIETRVENIEKQRIDFVIGNISYKEKRPSVIPELIIEAKVFADGFTNGQLSRRLKEVKKDILKISEMKLNIPKFILIYDYHNYLESKIIELTEYRNSLDNELKIIRIVKNGKSNIKEIY